MAILTTFLMLFYYSVVIVMDTHAIWNRSGIINHGSNCYMNAVLQFLYSMDDFKELTFTLKSVDPFICSLKKIFTDLGNGKKMLIHNR